ncbi:phospholipase/carboxylesterase, partial [Phenoliferia sp. Uapishka_3]
MAKQMVVPALGKHTATIIFSHGLGDSAAGWHPFAQSLSRRFQHIKWILPTASVQPVTLNGGYPMNSWFDIKSLDPPGKGLPSSEDEAGMLKSVKRISDLVAAEVDAGIPADRIVVGGFSQGAVIALLTSLTMERKIAGVISLSGWLALNEKIHMMQTEHASKLPVFWGHGTADGVVKYIWGQMSVEKLKTLGYKNIDFNSYPGPVSFSLPIGTTCTHFHHIIGMQHSLCDEEQSDVENWLRKVLPSL